MVTLILTTMNEVDGVKHIWDRINLNLFKQVIVVDNHSTDGTLEFLKDKPCKIIQQTKNGRGNAIREAMPHVNDDAVMLMSSDGNDDPKYIPEVLEKFNEGYDLVFGTRFVSGGASDDSDDRYGLRKFGNRVLTSLVNIFFSAHYSDTCFGGLRLFKRSIWDLMKIDSEWNETEYLMSIRAAKLKLKVAQISMVEGARVGGTVKAKTWSTGFNHLGVLFKELF